MGVGQPQGMLLLEFGDRVRAAFGAMAYQVGSSLEKKEGWRDVDVRCLLTAEQWSALDLQDPQNCHQDPKWRALCVVFSDYGRHYTGLPIDFQLQRIAEANAEFAGRPRGALFADRSFISAAHSEPATVAPSVAHKEVSGTDAVWRMRDEFLQLADAWNKAGEFSSAMDAQTMAIALNKFEDDHVITEIAWPARVDDGSLIEVD